MIRNWEIFDDNLIKVVGASPLPTGRSVERPSLDGLWGEGESEGAPLPSSGAIACRKTGVFDALWRLLLPEGDGACSGGRDEALQFQSGAEPAPGSHFPRREGRLDPVCRGRSRQARAQDGGILRPQSLRDNSDSRTRRRDEDRRDDRNLPLYRGAMAGVEPVRLNRARAGDDRDVAAPARMAAPLSDCAGRPSQPSENGGDGVPPGSRLGGGQSTKGA